MNDSDSDPRFGDLRASPAVWAPKFGDLVAFSEGFCKTVSMRFGKGYTYIVLQSFVHGHGDDLGVEARRLLLPDGSIGWESLDALRSKYIVVSRVDA